MVTRRIHSYEPAKGHGLRHDPFNAIVGPRPIGWIASSDAQGRLNLAPYSFFNAFNYKPPIVGFASTGWKDTVANVAATGEFTWNLVTKPLASAMNATSRSVAPGQDEFEIADLAKTPSTLIGVPRVAESPVSFECRLTQQIQLQTKEGTAVETWMTLGEVVAVHIDEAYLRDGVYQTAEARPILRGGGPGDYFDVMLENRFVMMRPQG